jgi:phenylalanine-4-hydroxylase
MALERVPAHLRQLVVEQAYERYTTIDQAVWRFVLLQTYSRLVDSAHPAYREGLAATGISVERIPSIAEMNDKLARFGWGAVGVDGFIPPRAFQEFQAVGILPIATEIRSHQHLVYTPAPDIIHEAAGHAPILPDPVFAAYLRRIGEVGKKAFTLPEENAVYRAVYTLSELKEDPSATEQAIAGAYAELDRALKTAAEPSEAARLSRLYWWTAEYGLVGSPEAYKLYGAGLLSSLWESHACHDPSVRKIPLDEGCMEVAYDITRPQAQLFVVRDFEALHEVLERAERSLAQTQGGRLALERAMRSRELASFEFSSGAWVMGVLRGAGPAGPPPIEEPAWLDFEGPVAFAWDSAMAQQDGGLSRPASQCVLTGPLEGGARLDYITDEALARLRGPSGRHEIGFASGARAEGRLERVARRPDGRLAYVELSDAKLDLPGSGPRQLARHVLLAAGDMVTGHAGAVDPKYHADTPPSALRVPRPRDLPPGERSLLQLFAKAEAAHRAGAPGMAHAFGSILASLDRDFPKEWLLRWNMLESLLKADVATGGSSELVQRLRKDLERLEVTFNYREPIASGLHYLARLAA